MAKVRSSQKSGIYAPKEAAKRRDIALKEALKMRPMEHGKGPERKVKKTPAHKAKG
jgi:hypothetical protein